MPRPSTGKPYSQLPNAFRYRTEAVAGCTCNGKDQAGLASVPVENDPTLRKGDIVAGANGLVVANPDGGKHAEAEFHAAAGQGARALQARARGGAGVASKSAAQTVWLIAVVCRSLRVPDMEPGREQRVQTG